MSVKREIQLGELIDASAERDAVHVAVAPMVAAGRLSPGQHVGLVNGEATAKAIQSIGIVDPFLRGPVFKGDRFWLFLYPNTITSLRHDWTHPSFGVKPPASSDISVTYLENLAAACNMPYAEFMVMLDNAANREYGALYTNGSDGVTADDDLWDHYEAVTGRKVDPISRGNTYFSCSC